MSDPVVADFVAKFNTERLPRGEPITGRVLLSRQELVLAADSEHATSIPLTSISDIGVGQVPEDLGGFFDATITIAFERNDKRFVAAIEAGNETIDKFSSVLFKTLLNGTHVTVKHPASVGGRVLNEPFRDATVQLSDRAVSFDGDTDSAAIEMGGVVGFDRMRQDIDGTTYPLLIVHHLVDSSAHLSLIAMESPRKLSILGRYLRQAYSKHRGELEDVELGATETKILIALFAGARGRETLSELLDVDTSKITLLVQKLVDAGLVVDGAEHPTLSLKGHICVYSHADEVF